MAVEYFCCYHSYARKLAKLSDQEVGRLFRALLEYSETGEAQELTGRESVAFDFIADDIDRAKEKYDAKCQKNRENAKANAIERTRSHANGCEESQYKDKDKEKDKDEDKDKDEFDLAESKDSACRTDVQRVVDAWNSLDLQKVTKLVAGTDRYTWLKKRLKDYGVDEVLRAIENARTSDFLMGRADTKKPFKFTFDWFLRPNNFVKVLDGNYNNRFGGGSGSGGTYEKTEGSL